MLFEYDWHKAEPLYQAAMVSSPWGTEGWAGALLLVGRYQESLHLYEQVRTLDPLSPLVRIKVALARSAMGDLDLALEDVRELEAFFPTANPLLLSMRASLLLQQDKAADALSAAEQLMAAAPGWSMSAPTKVVALLANGRRGEAAALLRDFESSSGDEHPYLLGIAHGWLGEFEVAQRWLLDAIARHDPLASNIVWDPALAPMRARPEFRAVWNAVPGLTLFASYPGGPRPPASSSTR